MTEEEKLALQIEKDNLEALAEAAVWLGERLSATSDGFMLTEAMSLTVKSEKGYQKAAHTGGEEFKVTAGYHGKRDGAILVFTPVMASNYTLMEMPVAKAKEVLSGLPAALKTIGWDDRVKHITAEKNKARESLANTERQQIYGDNFASW